MNPETREKFRKLRIEFESGDGNGNFKSIPELAKEYGVSDNKIYVRLKRDNWDTTKNNRYAKMTRRRKNLKVNGWLVAKVKKFGGRLSGKELATLIGVSEPTLVKYRNEGERAIRKISDWMAKNNINPEETDILQVVEKTDILDPTEVWLAKLCLAWEKSIAEKELHLLDVIEKSINGDEYDDHVIEHDVDESGNRRIRKITTRKIKVKPDVATAKWYLQCVEPYRKKYVQPKEAEITLQGGDRPILLEERKKLIEEVLAKFPDNAAKQLEGNEQ